VQETVELRGWVHAIRDQKRMQFVVLRDETGLAQLILGKQEQPSELNEAISALTPESAVTVTGLVVADERVKLGGLEIQLASLSVDSPAEPELPVTPESALDKRIDWRYLDLRRPDRRLIFEVQSTVEHAMREYWREQDFIEIHTPKLMGTASESGAEVFEVGYFGRPAYLAQSPQFYKQMAIAAGVDRVFEIAPVFRAEPSFTSRHATEFTGVDVELAWITDVEDVMSFEERMLAATLAAVAAEHGPAIKAELGVDVTVPSVPFPRITMAQAQSIVGRAGVRGDLDPAGERALGAYAQEKYGHEFVFVTSYPTSVRPFYHMRPPGSPDLTYSFDLLWKGLEITTGAQREHRYDVLLRQVAENGLSAEPMLDYLNCFKYGCPPHGGLGLGLGRFLMVLLGLESIRDATFLFRGPNRLTP